MALLEKSKLEDVLSHLLCYTVACRAQMHFGMYEWRELHDSLTLVLTRQRKRGINYVSTCRGDGVDRTRLGQMCGVLSGHARASGDGEHPRACLFPDGKRVLSPARGVSRRPHDW